MLELEHLQKSFDGVPVLKDISLQVEDGEIVSILGPSGCGKTTLLNMILGIVDADQGAIRYNGEDLTRTPMEKRGFNIVFQDYALFPNLNVQQNITYGLRNKPGISSQEEVDELIDLLGLREHLNKRIDQLSGGQKQRVALARTLVMKPPDSPAGRAPVRPGRGHQGVHQGPHQDHRPGVPPDHHHRHPRPGGGPHPVRPGAHHRPGDHLPVRQAGRDHPPAQERLCAQVYSPPAGDQAGQHLRPVRRPPSAGR